MNCGGCIRSGYRLVPRPGGGFCIVSCTDGPPAPTEPVVVSGPDASDLTGMTAQMYIASNPGGGPVIIDWSDGSPTDEAEVGETILHTYTSPGTYAITVTSAADPSKVTVVSETVPFSIPRTWAEVKSTWATWGDIDEPTWADLLTFTPVA